MCVITEPRNWRMETCREQLRRKTTWPKNYRAAIFPVYIPSNTPSSLVDGFGRKRMVKSHGRMVGRAEGVWQEDTGRLARQGGKKETLGERREWG